MLRECRHCGETKPLAEFSNSRVCRFGKSYTCKQCMNVSTRAYRLARVSEEGRANDPPAPAERVCRKCGTTKPLEDFVRAFSCFHGRGHTCRECARAYTRAHGQRHATAKADKERERVEEARITYDGQVCARVATQRGATPVEVVYPLIVLERADGVCAICGEDVDPFKFDLDHREPCVIGGDHSYANIQLTHPSCNRKKGREDRRMAA